MLEFSNEQLVECFANKINFSSTNKYSVQRVVTKNLDKYGMWIDFMEPLRPHTNRVRWAVYRVLDNYYVKTNLLLTISFSKDMWHAVLSMDPRSLRHLHKNRKEIKRGDSFSKQKSAPSRVSKQNTPRASNRHKCDKARDKRCSG